MTCGMSLPAYTPFDWLELELPDLHTRDLIGWRFHLSFKSWTLFNFESWNSWKSPLCFPQCSSAKSEGKWRHPIQSEGAEAFQDFFNAAVWTVRKCSRAHISHTLFKLPTYANRQCGLFWFCQLLFCCISGIFYRKTYLRKQPVTSGGNKSTRTHISRTFNWPEIVIYSINAVISLILSRVPSFFPAVAGMTDCLACSKVDILILWP